VRDFIKLLTSKNCTSKELSEQQGRQTPFKKLQGISYSDCEKPKTKKKILKVAREKLYFLIKRQR
jgi:hypothetical protein